jgi:hypothetical protein
MARGEKPLRQVPVRTLVEVRLRPRVHAVVLPLRVCFQRLDELACGLRTDGIEVNDNSQLIERRTEPPMVRRDSSGLGGIDQSERGKDEALFCFEVSSEAGFEHPPSFESTRCPIGSCTRTSRRVSRPRS